MSLEITFCKSLDWNKSLNTLRLAMEFEDSVDVKEWFPEWYSKHGEEYEELVANDYELGNCNPFEDENNNIIYNKKFIAFCEKHGLSWLGMDDVIYDVNPGIEIFHGYSISFSRSEYSINTILQKFGIEDLYDVFGLNKNGSNLTYIPVDWNQASKIAKTVVMKLKKFKSQMRDCDFDYIVRKMKLVISFAKSIKDEDQSQYRICLS